MIHTKERRWFIAWGNSENSTDGGAWAGAGCQCMLETALAAWASSLIWVAHRRTALQYLQKVAHILRGNDNSSKEYLQKAKESRNGWWQACIQELQAFNTTAEDVEKIAHNRMAIRNLLRKKRAPRDWSGNINHNIAFTHLSVFRA